MNGIVPPSLRLLLLSFRTFHTALWARVQVNCQRALTNYASSRTCKPGELNGGPSPPGLWLLLVPSWDCVRSFLQEIQARRLAGSRDIRAETHAAAGESPGVNVKGSQVNQAGIASPVTCPSQHVFLLWVPIKIKSTRGKNRRSCFSSLLHNPDFASKVWHHFKQIN